MSNCVDSYRDTACGGEEREYRSRSGATVSIRCELHQQLYQDRMDRLDRELQERFPGWDNPHSCPPAWFDPLDAGEAWHPDE